MRGFTTVLCIALWLSIPVFSQHKHNAPATGTDLLEYCQPAFGMHGAKNPPDFDSELETATKMKVSWCAGFVQGTTSAVRVMQMIMQNKVPDEFTKESGPLGICLPPGKPLSNRQIARTFVKWLQEHPDELELPADYLALRILEETYPCKATAQP